MVISAAEVPSTLATYSELIFKTLPEEAALLRMDVAEVELKSTVTVLPLIVAGDTKFGAAMFYPQIIAAVTGLIPPPPDTVVQEVTPEPLVVRTCPFVPSFGGSIKK